MAIVINGSGTVTGISVGGLPDGIVDAGTLATDSVDSAELIDGSIDTAHIAADQITSAIMPTGSVLQVIQTSDTAQTELTTTATWTDVVPTATITPTSSSSKILVLHSAGGMSSCANGSQSIRLLRGATEICTHARQGYQSTTASVPINWDMKFLDSPSTTSATTYKFQIKLQSTGNLRHNSSSGSGVTNVASATTILMEIAG